MTCIVGLEYDGGVIIGGDSAAVTGDRIQISTKPKVFKLSKTIIGYTWSFRMGQIIQFSKGVPKIKKKASYEYLIAEFVPFIRDIFKDSGWLKTENSRDEGGQFLIGLSGKLFAIHADFSIQSFEDGFAAVGSGAAYALGAMYVLKEKVNYYSEIIEPPKYMVELALEAAAHYSTGVSAPFKFVALENEDGK